MQIPGVTFILPVSIGSSLEIIVADKECSFTCGDGLHQDDSKTKINKSSKPRRLLLRCLRLSHSFRFGDIPPLRYRGANTFSKKFEMSEMYRRAAVKSYFKRVDKVCRTKGDRLTERDVTRHITLARLELSQTLQYCSFFRHIVY